MFNPNLHEEKLFAYLERKSVDSDLKDVLNFLASDSLSFMSFNIASKCIDQMSNEENEDEFAF